MIKTIQTIFPDNEIKIQKLGSTQYITVTFEIKEQEKVFEIIKKFKDLGCANNNCSSRISRRNPNITYFVIPFQLNHELLSQKSIELKKYVAELFDKTTETSPLHNSNPNSQQKNSIQNNPGELPKKNLENNKDNYDHAQQNTTEIEITSKTFILAIRDFVDQKNYQAAEDEFGLILGEIQRKGSIKDIVLLINNSHTLLQFFSEDAETTEQRKTWMDRFLKIIESESVLQYCKNEKNDGVILKISDYHSIHNNLLKKPLKPLLQSKKTEEQIDFFDKRTTMIRNAHMALRLAKLVNNNTVIQKNIMDLNHLEQELYDYFFTLFSEQMETSTLPKEADISWIEDRCKTLLSHYQFHAARKIICRAFEDNYRTQSTIATIKINSRFDTAELYKLRQQINTQELNFNKCNNLSLWQCYYQQLDKYRNTLPDWLKKDYKIATYDYAKILETQQKFNENIFILIKNIFTDCVKFLGLPPKLCTFALIGMGSLSRQEMAPYSDLECGFLIADNFPENDQYFKNLLNLFNFKIELLGERDGLHIDEQSIPVVKYCQLNTLVCGTPQSIIEAQADILGNYSVLNPILIYGSPSQNQNNLSGEDLFEQYNAAVTSRKAIVHKAIVIEDFKYWQTRLSKITSLTKDIDIKDQFLSALRYWILHVALYHNLTPDNTKRLNRPLNTQEALELLEQKEFFSKDYTKALREALRQIISIRYRQQLHLGKQTKPETVLLGYTLNLMTTEPDNTALKKATLYLYLKENQYNYKLLNDNNQSIVGKLIAIPGAKDCIAKLPKQLAENRKEKNQSLKNQIIKLITAHHEHTLLFDENRSYLATKQEIKWLKTIHQNLIIPLGYLLKYFNDYPYKLEYLKNFQIDLSNLKILTEIYQNQNDVKPTQVEKILLKDVDEIKTKLLQGDIKNFKILFDTSKEIIVNQIDFAQIKTENGEPDLNRQQIILDALLDGSYRNLNLSNCLTLTDDQLQKILQTSNKLQELRLSGCLKLSWRTIVSVMKKYQYLENLYLNDLAQLEILCEPWNIGTPPLKFSKLKNLFINNCSRLKTLSISASELRNLELNNAKALNFQNTKIFATKLQHLKLTGCNNIFGHNDKYFVPFINKFPYLEKLIYPEGDTGKVLMLRLITSRDENIDVDTDLSKLKLLLRLGIDLDYQDQQGETFLTLAKSNNKKHIVDYLLNNGINCQQSSWAGQIKNLELLQKLGFKIDEKDHDGNTALLAAVAANKIEAVKWLLKHGAPIDVKNNKGDTVFSLAYNNKDKEISALLADAFYNDGNIKMSLSRYKEAIKYYDRAIDLNPQHVKALNGYGIAKYKLGHYEEAIKVFDRAIALNPRYTSAFYNRGNVKKNLGCYEEVIKDFDQVIALNPQHAKAFNRRGIAKCNLGQHEEAIKDFNQAIALNPKNADTFFNRGLAKHNLDRYEEALKDYGQAIALNPKHEGAIHNREFVENKLIHCSFGNNF